MISGWCFIQPDFLFLQADGRWSHPIPRCYGEDQNNHQQNLKVYKDGFHCVNIFHFSFLLNLFQTLAILRYGNKLGSSRENLKYCISSKKHKIHPYKCTNLQRKSKNITYNSLFHLCYHCNITTIIAIIITQKHGPHSSWSSSARNDQRGKMIKIRRLLSDHHSSAKRGESQTPPLYLSPLRG